MTEPRYIELHARSAFSFLRGASQPEQLAEQAARLGLPAMAVCDRDGVYGAPRFFQTARQQGVKAFVGAEVTLADGSALPLLAMNHTGYQNLCRLITEAKLVERASPLACRAGPLDHAVGRGALGKATVEEAGPTEKDRKRPCFATWTEIERFSEGLIALTGDEEGPILRAWAQDGPQAASSALWRLAGIFGHDRLFVEVQCHFARGDERRLRFLADLAAAHALPMLATGGVTQATRAEREVADAFTCLRHHTTLDAAGRLLAPNAERHLRSARCMHTMFRDFPEAVANTLRVAERLEFTLRDLGYRFPDFPVEPGETQESALRKQVYAGARERYGGQITPAARAQLEKELALIAKLGFCGYFLVVWDICRWCRERGILIQGRGSAANSLVCYALHITAVDPIKYQLFFERFLSEGRVGPDGHPSWPDIDLDLPSGDLRESAIQELYRRYAPRGAAMTANVITYRGRSAAREMGKVLGLSDDVMDRFSSLYAGGDFPHTLKLEDQLRMSGLADDHPRLPALARLYRRVYGLPRHLGQHSGGMVICAGQLDGVVPLEPASMEDRVVVQWDKDDCEDLGIVKVDLLGLGMMAVLQDCFTLCNERGGERLGMDTLPPDDTKTFAMMQEADTVGVFQIESRAQMSTLRKFKPACFYDVAMEVAIVRPGPIVARVAHPLLKRRTGTEDIVCLDPSVHEIMQPVLQRTYGVILFQEQMLQVAVKLAGFTPTEAEELRRAMGFTRGTERLARIMDKLCTSMRVRGHNETVIEMVQESAYSFALYGFPEAHSISFALLAYASTWLKAHRPAEFVASLLNNQPMGFYSPATLVQDSRRHGVKFRPVCVAHSEARCTIEPDGAVRLGLNYVKGVRAAAIAAMLAAREERPFASLEDWLARTTFTAGERRALASVGALNALASHRRAALWQVEAAWEAEETLFKTVAGLAEAGPGSAAPGTVPGSATPAAGGEGEPLAPMTLAERYHADFGGLTLTTGAHPMTLVREQLPDAWRATDLPLARHGDRVKVAGSVICRQRPGTAKGFVFVSLEDETGIANAVVTPQLFEKHRLVLTQSHALAITGRLQNQDGVIHIKAERFEPLVPVELPEGTSHDFH